MTSPSVAARVPLDDPLVLSFRQARINIELARWKAMEELVNEMVRTPDLLSQLDSQPYGSASSTAFYEAENTLAHRESHPPCQLTATLCSWCCAPEQEALLTEDLAYAVSVAKEVCRG